MTDENPERVRPDEVFHPNTPVEKNKVLRDAVLLIPNIVKLVGRLLKDPRVPRRSKIALGAAAAYVVSPIDLVPEVVPVVGWADDIIVILMAIDSLIHRSGPEIVEEHWDGPGDILGLVEDVLALTRSLVPKRLRSLFDRISG